MDIANATNFMKVAFIKNFLVRISCKFQGFPRNFEFSMELSPKIVSLDLRIFYRWNF